MNKIITRLILLFLALSCGARSETCHAFQLATDQSGQDRERSSASFEPGSIVQAAPIPPDLPSEKIRTINYQEELTGQRPLPPIISGRKHPTDLKRSPSVSTDGSGDSRVQERSFNLLSPIPVAAEPTPQPMVPVVTSPSRVETAQWQNAASPSGGSLTRNGGTNTNQPFQPVVPITRPSSQSVDPVVPQAPVSVTEVAPGNQPNAGTPDVPQVEIPWTDGNEVSQPYPSVTGNPTPANPTYFHPPQGEAPVISDSGTGCPQCGGAGCPSCQSGGSPGVCSQCGGAGCSQCGNADGLSDNAGYGGGLTGDAFEMFGSVARARRYVHLEALYITRSDGTIVNSNFGGLGAFDGNAGWRYTIGERRNSIRGTEFSYMGTANIDSSITRTDAAARLSALFATSPVLGSGETSPFYDAVIQRESKETMFHSFEYNRVRWGWDVLKTFVGLRYIRVDDSYDMFSQDLLADVGNLNLDAENNLFGVQLGHEFFYDVGYRLSFSFVGKGGLYANLNRFKSHLSKNGTTIINNEDNNTTFSTSIELGLIGHYQLNQRARFRVGYNVLWLDRVLTVSDNFPGVVSPFMGVNTSDRDDMLFHGLSFGFEFFR